MLVELSKVTFTNDFAYIDCPDGSTLILNKLDEAIFDGEKESIIKNINIALVDIDENYYNCNMAVGLSNDFIHLYSEHKEIEGQVLTLDNINLCFIEVFDE